MLRLREGYMYLQHESYFIKQFFVIKYKFSTKLQMRDAGI